jgi:hypothetical protein
MGFRVTGGLRIAPVVAAVLTVCLGLAAGTRCDGREKVDQGLAGLKVGDPLFKAKRLYPQLRAEGTGEASGEMWSARAGGCYVSVSADHPMRETEMIAVGRVDNQDLGECANLRSGRGLRKPWVLQRIPG